MKTQEGKALLWVIVLTAIVGGIIVLMISYPSMADVAQTATNIISVRIKEAGGSYGQRGYGYVDFIAGHGLDKADTYTSTTNTFELSVDETELDGTLIPGAGCSVTTLAGDGLVPDHPEIDVNAGHGIQVGSDEVQIKLADIDGDGIHIAGTELEVDTGKGLDLNAGLVRIPPDGIDETLPDWGTGALQVDSADVPNVVTNFNNNLGVGDATVLAALETIDDISITDDQTMDETYNEGHSVTVDAGAVLWGSSGAGTAWNSRTVMSHIDTLTIVGASASKAIEVIYLESDLTADNPHYYLIMAASIDSGVTIVEEFGFQLNGTFHLGLDASGELRIYDDQGDGTYVEIKVPADLAASWDFTIPGDNGANGEVFTTDGTGVTSWTAKTTDTNTITQTYHFGLEGIFTSAGTIILDSAGAFAPGCPVSLTGNIDDVDVYVATWAPNGGNDQLEITISYGLPASLSTDQNNNTSGANRYSYNPNLGVTDGSDIIKVQVDVTNVDGADLIRDISITLVVTGS